MAVLCVMCCFWGGIKPYDTHGSIPQLGQGIFYNLKHRLSQDNNTMIMFGSSILKEIY